MNERIKILTDKTIEELREIIAETGKTLDDDKVNDLQYTCYLMDKDMQAFPDSVPNVKKLVDAFRKLSDPDRKLIAQRVECAYTNYLRQSICVLKKWVEDLQAIPICPEKDDYAGIYKRVPFNEKEFRDRLRISDNFNPDVTYKGKLEEKFEKALICMDDEFYTHSDGRGDQKHPIVYFRAEMISNLIEFFDKDLGLEPKGDTFTRFIKTVLTQLRLIEQHFDNETFRSLIKTQRRKYKK